MLVTTCDQGDDETHEYFLVFNLFDSHPIHVILHVFWPTTDSVRCKIVNISIIDLHNLASDSVNNVLTVIAKSRVFGLVS